MSLTGLREMVVVARGNVGDAVVVVCVYISLILLTFNKLAQGAASYLPRHFYLETVLGGAAFGCRVA